MPISHTRTYGSATSTRPRRREWNPDARALAKDLKTKHETLAAILGVSRADLEGPRLSRETRERMAKLKQIVKMLEDLYGDRDHAVGWLRTKSELWSEGGDLSAISYMTQNPRAMEVVYQTVWRMRRGEPET